MTRTAAAALAAGGLVACAPPVSEPTVMPSERWCYRTLAEPDCHAVPLAEAEARRVGWFDAATVE